MPADIILTPNNNINTSNMNNNVTNDVLEIKNILRLHRTINSIQLVTTGLSENSSYLSTGFNGLLQNKKDGLDLAFKRFNNLVDNL